MKILFVCALFIEAKPLIDTFALKKTENIKSFQFYSNDEIFLVFTGTGKVNLSVGLTLAFQKIKQDACHVINWGICGSVRDEIGEMFLVNKVSDADTGRDFYPDNLIKSDLLQKTLLTVSKPLVLKYKNNDTSLCLIDMEGSAFFETASFFVPVHRIFLLKIVSDNLDQKTLNKDKIKNLLNAKVNDAESFVGKLKKTLKSDNPTSDLLFNLQEKVHFTATQKVNLQNWLHDISVQNEERLDELLEKIEEKINKKKNSKENGKIVYEFINKYWREMY